jgi:hypothetical protein
MGLKKAYDKLTDSPEFTEGLIISKGESVQDHNQRNILKARSGNPSLYYHSDGTLIGDKVGDFPAIAYRSSESAPGTLELSNANLRLPTGQFIEDEVGTSRIEFRSNDTLLRPPSGGDQFFIRDGQIQANADNLFRIRDTDGDFNAVEYKSSSSRPGTLDLTNAKVDIGQNQFIRNFPDSGDNDYSVLWQTPNAFSAGERVGRVDNADSNSFYNIPGQGRNGFYFVIGYDTANNGVFLDLILITRSTVSVVASEAQNGPDTRSYNGNNGKLQVTADNNGVFDIRAKSIGVDWNQ